MDAKRRREIILHTLQKADGPISASIFAQKFCVSRQVIVGDVALLRASGAEISATPRGYICHRDASARSPYEGILACRHTPAQLKDELYTIVDLGGSVLDVTIEHPLYGQLSGPLDLHSRYDVDLFLKRLESSDSAKPLSVLTDGIHLHRIGCQKEINFFIIKEALEKKGLLFNPSD